MTKLSTLLLVSIITATFARAEVRLPSIFSNNMILQQGIKCPMWGWADPGEKVTVTVNGMEHKAVADKSSQWRVKLQKLETSNDPIAITIQGKNSIELKNVLIGEVWVCSGQSNMGFPVAAANDPDLEQLSANYPNTESPLIEKLKHSRIYWSKQRTILLL